MPADLLGTEEAHPPVPRVPTLPSAHLPALGPGEPPWAALAPRCRGWGVVHAGLWTNSQATFSTTEARKPPQSQCSGHRSPRHSWPPDGALGIRSQHRAAGRWSPIFISGSGTTPRNPLLSLSSSSHFCLLPHLSPICRGEMGIKWGGLSSSIPRIPGLSCAPRCDERHPWPRPG